MDSVVVLVLVLILVLILVLVLVIAGALAMAQAPLIWWMQRLTQQFRRMIAFDCAILQLQVRRRGRLRKDVAEAE